MKGRDGEMFRWSVVLFCFFFVCCCLLTCTLNVLVESPFLLSLAWGQVLWGKPLRLFSFVQTTSCLGRLYRLFDGTSPTIISEECDVLPRLRIDLVDVDSSIWFLVVASCLCLGRPSPSSRHQCYWSDRYNNASTKKPENLLWKFLKYVTFVPCFT